VGSVTDAQTALLSVGSIFVAAILTAFGSRWITGVQADREARERELDRDLQREQARLVDERSLRDAKRERLRRDYEDLAFAATEIQGATLELAMLWRGDTEEARNARVNERLNEATKDMGRAILRLRLEGEEDLVARYQAIRSLWWEYTELLTSEDRRKYGKISETLTKLEPAVEAILQKTKSTLEDLSRPL
jgi:hypothetical protein